MRVPKTAMKAVAAMRVEKSTTPLARPRRHPWLDNQETAGSIAMDSSHARSMRNRKPLVESHIHEAMR